MKKILVIGGAGYIGGITTDKLVESGHTVTVYDRLLYETRFLKNVDFEYGDIRDTNRLVNIHQKYDDIIWLAALVGDGACHQDPALTRSLNVTAIKDFLSKTKRRIIFTSTCSVYGAQTNILTEASPTNPLSEYAATKLEAEKYVLDNNGLVFRLGTLFGLGDRFSRIRLDLVVNILTLRAFRDKKITVFGGEQWRPLLAVTDVGDYLVEALGHKENDLYNLKYKNYKLIDLAREISHQFSGVKLEVTDMNFEDLRNYRVNSAKADKVFKFKPRTSIKDEVSKMKQLFQHHRIKEPDDDIYYNSNIVTNLVRNNDLEVYGDRT